MSDSTVPVLSVKGLECVRNDIVLFSGLDFRLAGGELLQITGANGSGKTSLLRIICGLAQPSEGAVYWNARDIQEYNAEYSREISYIGHYNGIKAELTPQENLNIAQVLCQSRHDVSPLQALNQFGLNGYAAVPVRKLSSGQRRRVALSRLLFSGGRLWVLDEPFTSVDEEGKHLIRNVLESHLGTGGMVVLATHEPLDSSHYPLQGIRL